MVFSSMVFIALFLPLVFVLYFASKNPRVRNGVLLAFSLVFYAWGEPKWIFVMLLTVTVNYFCGLLISNTQNKPRRTLFMIIGVSLSLGFLFYFKYFGFFSDVVMQLLGRENSFTKPVLPIGISFYTFATVGYIVDIGVGKYKAERHLGRFALFIFSSFFSP